MTFSTLIARTWLLAHGNNVPPKSNTMDYKRVLTIANTYIDQWQDEPGINWNSLYVRQQQTGTVTATDTFTLHANVRKISQNEGDYVVITHTDGSFSYYVVVPPDQLQEQADANACAQAGSSLIFSSAFTASSAQIGGTIKVPGYSAAANMTGDNSVVPVDNPEWLIYMSAIELIRDKPEKKATVESLTKLAEVAMERMKLENIAQGDKPVIESKK